MFQIYFRTHGFVGGDIPIKHKVTVLFVLFFFLNFDINFKIRLFPTSLPSPDRNSEEDLIRDPSCLHHGLDLSAFIKQPSSENVQQMKQESVEYTWVIQESHYTPPSH